MDNIVIFDFYLIPIMKTYWSQSDLKWIIQENEEFSFKCPTGDE